MRLKKWKLRDRQVAHHLQQAQILLHQVSEPTASHSVRLLQGPQVSSQLRQLHDQVEINGQRTMQIGLQNLKILASGDVLGEPLQQQTQ